ncbi:MAG: metallopeptidase [Verrucomicrobiales bacterium]|nr:metallopeptidase [Verrucomicrobiales bacterium]|tara:strand:- start:739 stop:1497 length:759 start_codon:yes stop_codon:yes gene_type:complete
MIYSKLLRGLAIAGLVLVFCQTQSAEAARNRKDVKSAKAHRFEPVLKKIEGWTVHVDPALLKGEHAEEGGEALRMLADHLNRIAILVPEPQLTDLRKMEIWIERHHPLLGAMQYHPAVGWLRARGHDPRLAKMVHITRAAQLLEREQLLKHPAVILHELAHAYHDQILGFKHPEIVDAYKSAKESGTYEKVLLYTGRQVRHYGMNNEKEYFAEGTEAWFYRNDFYPFVRAELKEHDPKFHSVLEKIWGAKER